ncbi:MAG: molybdopterin biosynthesis protein MoeB [Lutibacter sp.]|nr:MAG: molybdopterin biosynthesis protein MoeB [Lutibacter sp.]
MKITKRQLFQRQTTLTEIGEKGQQLLQKSKVLVIGCGGLGSPVAVYLAASGIGKLHLVDFDTVSVSNLHRQVFYSLDDIGKSKAATLSKFIQQRAPFSKITYSNNAVNKENILPLIAQFDVVVDGTDSLPVKYLINDACVLQNKPLVYGSLYKFDGYVATFNIKQADGSYSANLRDAFPKIATDIPNCEEAGTLNPIVGIIALQQVNEVVKLLTKTGKLLLNKLLIFNSLRNSQFNLKLKPTFSKKSIQLLFEKEDYKINTCEFQDERLLISAEELKRSIDQYSVINVINNPHTKLPFSANYNMPYNTFNIADFSPDFNLKYVVVCTRGITSYDVTTKLKQQYPNLSIVSLKEGIKKY